MKHSISHRRVSDDLVFVHVNTHIDNPSSVKLDVRKAVFRIQQVLPLAGDVLDAIGRKENPIRGQELELPWPGLAERRPEWNKGELEIEPGESDEILCDFLIPSDVTTVEIYSHLENAAKRRETPIGWGITTLYDLMPAAPATLVRTVDNLTGKEAAHAETRDAAAETQADP